MNGLFGGGNGTSLTPYLVEDILDLNAVRNNLSAYYRQTQNIEFNGTGYDVTGWTPIGNNTTPFTGNYDGGNYKIRNMYIRDTTFDNYGLFGRIAGVPTITKVSNVILENVDILECSINPTGALAGIINANSSNNDKVIIENCHMSGYVRSKGGYCGGLIGRVIVTNNSTNFLYDVYRCSSSGYVNMNSSGSSPIGGLIGSVGGTKARVINSYSTANVTANGASAVGGLIGELYDYYPMDYVEYCFALGNVIGSNYVGGLVGWSGGNSSTTIRKSYSKGNVTALYGASAASIGGFIGYKRAGTTSECYSTGHITAPNSTAPTRTGGFIGFYEAGTNNACLWDKDTSGKVNAYGGIAGDATGIYGKTTAEMKNKATYIGLGWSI